MKRNLCLTAVALAGPNAAVVGPNGVVGPIGANNGTVTLNADGSFTYVPRRLFNGTDTFQYRAFDGAFFTPTSI